ncbi:MAG: hypothetical protein HZB87_12845 [Desulfatitalea sp.]|nr:hypothetical protein [Desulfatitalea sp.]
MYHPCIGNGPFPATTLTGGWTNTYEDMSWLANHLVTHGYIIFSMTPNFILGVNRQWTACHVAGVQMLQQENTRAGSAIRGKVATNKLQIMGFSKGGGGALKAAAEVGAQVVTTQALAPYQDGPWNFTNIKSDCIVLGGHNDRLAWDSRVIRQYNDIPESNDRLIGIFEGLAHGGWFDIVGDGSGDPATAHDSAKIKTYITSWMKIYLDGNSGYESYIDGHQNWFTTYACNEDAVEGQH